MKIGDVTVERYYGRKKRRFSKGKWWTITSPFNCPWLRNAKNEKEALEKVLDEEVYFLINPNKEEERELRLALAFLECSED